MTRESSDLLLRVDGLEVGFPGTDRHDIVRGISFELRKGEVLGIVGESGSGKTLSALSVIGLLPFGLRVTGGSIQFKGEELTTSSSRRLSEIRGRHIGLVFQDPTTALNPIMRIGDQVCEPLQIHRLARHSKALETAEVGLQAVGIPTPNENLSRYPHEFSGGMRQRAVIATALIGRPELIIADEPTTALDVTVQAQILDLFRRLNRERGVALLLISHDLGVVSEFCNRIAVMYAGRIVETGPTEGLLASPQHPYTRALLESIPSARFSRQLALRAISGEPPAGDDLPSGCPFHPRCRDAIDKCASGEPNLKRINATWSACWVAQDGGLSTIEEPRVATKIYRRTPTIDNGPLLQVEDLQCHFPVPGRFPWQRGRKVHAVNGVSLTLDRGQTLGIVGESGCGKSTLARCILRLIPFDHGRVLFRGHDIRELDGDGLRQVRRHMQPVFQDPYASLNPRWPVRAIVAEPLLAQDGISPEVWRRVDETLDLVGLSSRYGRRLPRELSGGQRQRVAIARALVLRPELVVADEPLSSLDVSVQAQIINLLHELQSRLGLSILFISHDLRAVRFLSANIAVMFLGKVVEFGDADAVCTNPLHPYTAALLSAVPTLRGDDARGERVILAGDPPSPLAPPSGCCFRTRCRFAKPECEEREPTLLGYGARGRVACHFALAAGNRIQTQEQAVIQ
jgi:peptide/nickel transport system ATP-binding protein